MRAARELGAQNVPKAELHLRLAQEEVVKARKCSEDGDNERAAMLLNRAHADAELAIALSRQSNAQRDLESNTQSAVAPKTATVSAER